MIEIFERIRFRAGAAYAWDRSYDGGRTWIPIPWSYKELPFVQMEESPWPWDQTTRQEHSE